MSLKFSNDIIEIPQEMKITLWRLNDEVVSPYQYSKWDLSAKTVKDIDGVGIYGVWDEQLRYYGSEYFASIIMTHTNNNPILLKLEADKRDIVLINDNEIAVNKCNIVGVFDINELMSISPFYNSVIYWAKVVKQPSPKYFSIERDKALSETLKLLKINVSQSIFDKDSPIHGYSHFLRVFRNIVLLGNHYKFERSSIELFAYYHDILRLNDGDDPQHGKRGAELFKNGIAPKYYNMQNDIVDKVCFACENHTTLLRSGDSLIDICFDADRLDLMRVGVKPDPKKMATHIGAHYAENYECYMADFQNLST
ncbi:MAG: HD domain-containing protein [Dysgonamonadaceae bacterium]|nr:HD domain-containing protein [Dysgonamonadaceae bacterium]